MTTLSPSAGYFRAAASTTLITAIFALVWGFSGSFAIPGSTRLVCIVFVLLVSAFLLGSAFSFWQHAAALPATDPHAANPFRSRLYNLAVAGQFVAIFLAARLLTAFGYPDAIISAVAMIVGLHFFALIPVFQSRRFAVVGGAMILLGLASLLLAPAVTLDATGATLGLRTAAVGLGCAVILWAGVVPLVAEAREQMRAARLRVGD